jgi:hypothetical protein
MSVIDCLVFPVAIYPPFFDGGPGRISSSIFLFPELSRPLKPKALRGIREKRLRQQSPNPGVAWSSMATSDEMLTPRQQCGQSVGM